MLFTASHIPDKISFNRNIVECKLQAGMNMVMNRAGFNRNIVECK